MKLHNYAKWLSTYTKRSVTAILVCSLVDLQLSYVLAFMGKDQIAESLSSTVASSVIVVMLGYFMKALFETFFEKREERLREERKGSVVDAVDFSVGGASDSVADHKSYG